MFLVWCHVKEVYYIADNIKQIEKWKATDNNEHMLQKVQGLKTSTINIHKVADRYVHREITI